MTTGKRNIVCLFLYLLTVAAFGQGYKQVNDISYTTKKDNYSSERLKLDIYYPTDKKDCPVVIWFHGSGPEGNPVPPTE